MHVCIVEYILFIEAQVMMNGWLSYVKKRRKGKQNGLRNIGTGYVCMGMEI